MSARSRKTHGGSRRIGWEGVFVQTKTEIMLSQPLQSIGRTLRPTKDVNSAIVDV